MNKIYFKGGGFTPLSNMSAFRVNYKGKDYMTAEHAYQAEKFLDPEIKIEIINTRSPFDAKSLAHKYKDRVRQDWLKVKISILKEIIREKLEQNFYIKQKLLSSGNAELIEATDDSFWGQGKDGNGKNIFGKMWMEIRKELQDNMKVILVDAINTFVDGEIGIFQKMYELLEQYPNRKIILTNANDEEIQNFDLGDLPYEVFTLKHNPNKSDRVYFEIMLKYFDLKAHDVIYFEHNKDAVKSARLVGITTYYYDPEIKDLEALQDFIENNL